MPVKVTARRKASERGLHLAVAKFLDMALPEDAIWHHSPNGGTRNVREAAQFKRMGTRPGWPDIEIIYRGWSYGVELKSAKGTLSVVQALTHQHLARAGMHIVICKSVDEVQSALDGWSIPVRARTFGWIQARLLKAKAA